LLHGFAQTALLKSEVKLTGAMPYWTVSSVTRTNIRVFNNVRLEMFVADMNWKLLATRRQNVPNA